MSDASDSRRLVLGPFNRVEGDLEVSLEIAAGRVRSARVNAPLYRGFENLLVGRPMEDALVLVPRICGICSVSQSAAASAALAHLAGAAMPANGRLATNLILASEVIVDHLTHFYLFFAPDFAREAYVDHPWFPEVRARFEALRGSATRDFLPARAQFLALVGTLAGKWPHTLALRPGGTTRPLLGGERVRLRAVLRSFRSFVERTYLGGPLEAFSAMTTRAELIAWAVTQPGDFSRWLRCALELGLEDAGAVPANTWISAGAYPDPGHGADLFPGGVWSAATGLQDFDSTLIREDATYARLHADAPLPPASGRTEPAIDKADAYTWCKAPRYAGLVAETGALARQVVSGQPLAHALVRESGGGVVARVVARAIEVARIIPAMERWLAALDADAPYLAAVDLPEQGEGVGCVEAARGTLGHWIAVRRGQIVRYQIVAPTTWNFSPRDTAGTPGPLEQALAGVPVGHRESTPVLVQHIVRSFDPCMVCTVH